MAGDGQAPARIQPRQTLELTLGECWKLLREASFGQVVFTMHALPAIRPVNHFIDGHAIIIRSHLGSAITGQASGDGAVVCYEADDIDPNRHTGWSVVATGMAGFTAYAGLTQIGRPKAGETVVVAAASGPVGATVGQLAKIFGARAAGIAGGPQKVATCAGSASTRRSTTGPATSRTSSPPRPRTGSTCTSRTSAGTSGPRSSRG
jgi:hypothetical protein